MNICQIHKIPPFRQVWFTGLTCNRFKALRFLINEFEFEFEFDNIKELAGFKCK